MKPDEALALIGEESRKHEPPCESATTRCPRCGWWSGDAWVQCRGGPCPMPASPVFSEPFLLAVGRGLAAKETDDHEP